MKFIMKFFLFLIVLFLLLWSATHYLTQSTHDEGDVPFYDGQGVLYHDLNKDCLSGDELFVYEDDNYKSMLGVDLSVYQRNIDFNVLKEAGIEFVYLRIGYRGYESGLLFKDNAFENLYRKAKEAGFKIGVYFFTSARDSIEIGQEVDFIEKHLQNKEIDLPIALDIEEIEDEYSRVKDLSNDDIMNNIHSFFIKTNEKGWDTILYTNTAYIKEHLNHKELSDYSLWLAQYSHFPDYEYPFVIWQYTCNGEIEGIDMPLDLNLMFIRK